MRRFLVTMAALVLTVSNAEPPRELLAGGESGPEDERWMCQVQAPDNPYLCMGALIDSQFVLALKSCIADDEFEVSAVRCGGFNSRTTAGFVRAVVNQTFLSPEGTNLALLQLRDDQLIEDIEPVVLPVRLDESVSPNGTATAYAYTGNRAGTLLSRNMNVVPCTSTDLPPAPSTGEVFCASFSDDGPPNSQDGQRCSGVTGAPFYTTQGNATALLGILVSSTGCGFQYFNAGFASPYHTIGWISSIVPSISTPQPTVAPTKQPTAGNVASIPDNNVSKSDDESGTAQWKSLILPISLGGVAVIGVGMVAYRRRSRSNSAVGQSASKQQDQIQMSRSSHHFGDQGGEQTGGPSSSPQGQGQQGAIIRELSVRFSNGLNSIRSSATLSRFSMSNKNKGPVPNNNVVAPSMPPGSYAGAPPPQGAYAPPPGSFGGSSPEKNGPMRSEPPAYFGNAAPGPVASPTHLGRQSQEEGGEKPRRGSKQTPHRKNSRLKSRKDDDTIDRKAKGISRLSRISSLSSVSSGRVPSARIKFLQKALSRQSQDGKHVSTKSTVSEILVDDISEMV